MPLTEINEERERERERERAGRVANRRIDKTTLTQRDAYEDRHSHPKAILTSKIA